MAWLFFLCAAGQFGVMLWAARLGIRHDLPFSSVAGLMVFAAANCAAMLTKGLGA